MKNLKFFGLMLSFALVITGTFMLSGCNANSFDAEKLTFNDTFSYDGNKHILEVEYEDVDLDVVYSTTIDGEYLPASNFNYVNAGTYDLYLKVSAEGYLDYVTSEPVSFEITKKNADVDIQNVVKLIEDKANPDYAQVLPTTNAADVIVAGDNLNLTFTIGNKVGTQTAFVASDVEPGDKYNIIPSYDNANYNVTFNNAFVEIKDNVEVVNGNNTVYYSTFDNTIFADLEEDSVITIYKDFTYAGTTDEIDVRLMAQDGTDYDFTLDLNGHSVAYRMTFTNRVSGSTFTTGKINVTVKNGSIGNTTTTDYGMTVFGNEDVVVNLENLSISGSSYGFSGNGYCEGATINAEDCTFFGGEAGFYAPSKYTYEFKDCSFTGATGYYAKSGDQTFTNCEFVGTQSTYAAPTYNGSGSHSTGSAIVIDSAQGYKVPMNVVLNNCSFKSISGYAIEEYSTSKTENQENCYATITVTDANYVLVGKNKAVFSENYPNDPEILEGVHQNDLETPAPTTPAE